MNRELIDLMFEHRDIIEQLVYYIGTNNYKKYCQYMKIYDNINHDITDELLTIIIFPCNNCFNFFNMP